ncbi:dienelactone hydrolase family protein [Gordonia aichiensis]|nr:dienelactone hydrolase family protein [Gordonia aichiensis]
MIEPTSSVLIVNGGDLPVREIALGAAPNGLVIVVLEPGMIDRYATEIMNRLAENGYESLATERMSGCHGAILDHAESRGWSPEQLGMIGIGLGGQQVLEAATTLKVGAAVSLSATSPTGSSEGILDSCAHDSLSTPWLGMFGKDDPGAGRSVLADLAQRLDAGSMIHAEIVSYDGVGRDFYQAADHGALGYGAWYDSWQRTIEWLGARVAPRLTAHALEWRRSHGQRC